MYSKFINIGDTFRAEQETFSTHRGINYLVSHVFNDNGHFRVFIADKNGKDIEILGEYFFSPTAKTVSMSAERQMKAKLDFLWNNSNTKLVINHPYYREEEKQYISFNKSHMYSYEYSGPTADIYKSIKGVGLVEGSRANIRTIEELYKYFKGIDVERLTIDGVFYTNQADIDHIQYMLTIPKFDETVLNRPSIEFISVDNYVHREKPNLDSFLKICSEVIFDEPDLSAENKQIVYNVIEAYELLPKSFGPTGCAKLLMGKEKKQNKTVEHLSGTCTKLKQPQMFELCNIIESFMYVSKIFVRTDDYSNGDEWRGAYEFIGSKAINTAELTKIKNELK